MRLNLRVIVPLLFANNITFHHSEGYSLSGVAEQFATQMGANATQVKYLGTCRTTKFFSGANYSLLQCIDFFAEPTVLILLLK